MLEQLKEEEKTLLFYESPHRIKDTLAELVNILGNRKVVAARELTKKFEEFLRGDVEYLIKYFKENTSIYFNLILFCRRGYQPLMSGVSVAPFPYPILLIYKILYI